MGISTAPQRRTFKESEREFDFLDRAIGQIKKHQHRPLLSQEIAKREQRAIHYNDSDRQVLAKLVEMIAYSNNVQVKTIEAIYATGAFDEIFGDYTPKTVAQLDPNNVLTSHWPQISGIRFKSKVTHMIHSALCLLDIKTEHGSFMKCLKDQQIPSFIRTDADFEQFWAGFDRVRNDLKAWGMPYFSNFTSLCHLFLEMGFDCAKPDSGVMKAAASLGIIEGERTSTVFPEKSRRQAVQFMQLYAIRRKLRVSVIDLYFLIHGGQTGAARYVKPEYYGR